MKKCFLVLIYNCCVLLLVQGQVKADKVELLNPNSSTIILIPDVQNYVKYDYNQPILELLTAWSTEQKKALNVAAVFCTGDLVDQNESLFPLYPRFGNLSSKAQWEFVSHAFARLDHKLPYFISPGNHDYGYTRSETDLTNYPDYFPIDKNSLWKDIICASFPNRQGRATLENAAFVLNIPNWKDVLLITTEFAPRDEVLKWIEELCASDTYKSYQVILMTHSYMSWDGTRIAKEGYKITGNAGQAIWDKLLNNSMNIKLLICGHYAIADEVYAHSTGFRKDKNAVGNEISQMMFNTQAIGGGMSGNGGDGWLRLLEFMPDGKQVSVRTYSPLFGFSAHTKHLAWRKEKYDDFTFSF